MTTLWTPCGHEAEGAVPCPFCLQARLGEALNLAKLFYQDCRGEDDLFALRLIETLEGKPPCEHNWIDITSVEHPAWECSHCGTHKFDMPVRHPCRYKSS